VADKLIDTAEKAQEYIEMNNLKASGANKVLRHLGLKRNPTADECRLYDKWSDDWGFTLDTVLCACREMTKINNPNFAYIDRILNAYRGKGLTSVAKIEAYTQEREATKSALMRIMDLLDIKGAPKSAQVNLYNKWLRDYGVSLETILLCCEQAKLAGSASFQEVDRLLSSVAQSGASSIAEAKAKLDDIFSLEKNISIAYERAGIRRLPTPPERAQFDQWFSELRMPFELVFLAAEYSAGTQAPFQFMKKIIENWREEGIKSVSAAKAAHKKRRYKAVNNTEDNAFDLSQYNDEELLKDALSPSQSTED
jgi:DnaD/phage-associated family protein